VAVIHGARALLSPPTQGEGARRRRVERIVHRVLLAGVWGASLLLVAGIVIDLGEHHGLPRRLVSAERLPVELSHLHPDALLTLGLVVLIATPIARVVGSTIAFLAAKDFRFALVSTVVLATMAASLLWGKG
jgi:uncharacterized membrane protein